MSSNFTLSVSPDGVGELVFDLKNEKVNKFSVSILEELEKVIDELSQNKSIKILAIKSGKENVFIAGADLHSFEPAFDNPSIAEKIIRTGHRVFAKLQELPFPTVAVIDGACLGGGLEFALSCTYRLVSDNSKTSLGLPEVTLGIFPGWGGTQRLPRLVGLENGLNMILSGKSVNAIKAYKIGLADQILPHAFLETKTQAFLKNPKHNHPSKSIRHYLLDANPLGRGLLFKQARSNVMEKTKGRYPAPLIALSVIEDTYTLPLSEGLKKEADTFIANIPQEFAQAPYLISLFFTQEALKKDPGTPDGKPQPIKAAALIGAGTMGATLAWLLTNSYIPTRMKDISWDFIGKGYATVKGLYSKGLKNRKITPSEAERKFNLLSSSIDYSGFQHANFILEAATENLEIKRQIFKEVEAVAPKDALIASNTSSLTIEEMSQNMQKPERFVGMHFFNPPNKMPLVEVVAGSKSSPNAIATAVDLSKKLGKTPIVVKDCPGFLVNRIFVQGANEVLYLLQEGVPQETITRHLLDFGMPMDPFLLADEVGNDVAYKVTKTFEKAYGPRMKGPQLITLLNEAKLFGKKTGQGFYLYKGDKVESNPAISTLLKNFDKPKNVSEADILPRFTSVMINEAAHCLQEGIIKEPAYLDMALIMGIGFPPYRGGLLKYADSLGIDKIVEELQTYQKVFGERFAPAQLLLNMQRDGKTFYDKK